MSAGRAGRGDGVAALSLAGFVVLGLPDGMWGTAWPAIRRTYGQPVGDLGLLLVAVTAGALLTSLTTARAVRRFGASASLASAAACGALAAGLLVAVRSWWAVVGAAFLIGATAGVLDAALNTLVAMSGRMRLLNMLHGAYGVGTALGPLVVTGALLLGSWRPAYAALLALEVLLGAGWLLAGPRRARAGAGTAAPHAGPDAAAPAHPRAAARLGVLVFFAYTGLEVTAGQWAATYLRGPIGLSAASAGAVVFAYWGALTAGRFAVAVPRRTPAPARLVRYGTLVALAGTLLIWWHPGRAALVVGIAVLGASLAPVFPALVALTPARVGAARAHRVIGWQIAAAGVGGAAVSAATGLVLQRAGLGAYPPVLAVTAAAVVLLALVLETLTRPGPAPGGAGLPVGAAAEPRAC
ncbi:MAG TPA: MFS transporter [Acidimicrobiales bacterium]|nr:MFS transporter [Acidimicrobiales bacterium]